MGIIAGVFIISFAFAFVLYALASFLLSRQNKFNDTNTLYFQALLFCIFLTPVLCGFGMPHGVPVIVPLIFAIVLAVFTELIQTSLLSIAVSFAITFPIVLAVMRHKYEREMS